jgi:NADPH:quinone reductase
MEETMQVLVAEKPGAPFIRRVIARPQPQAGEVLIRIHASGVNPLDTKIRASAAAHARHPLPAVLGVDCAGTIEAVGQGVTRFGVGDEVFGMIGGVGGIQGTMAEFAVADAQLIAKKPTNLSMREAAALPLGFITAWEGLVDRAGVHRGQTVLIHAGAGGVGQMAGQIAVARGATVYATASESKAPIVQRLGATPVNYHTTSVEQYLRERTADAGFDIVYDTVGGKTLDDSFAAVKRYTGHVLSCLGWGAHSLTPLSFRGATYSGVFTLLPLLTGQGRAHHGEILTEAAKLAEANQLRPVLHAREFSRDDIEDAHATVADGLAQGKVVVTIS